MEDESEVEVPHHLPSHMKIRLEHWKCESFGQERCFRMSRRRYFLLTSTQVRAVEGDHVVFRGSGDSHLSSEKAEHKAFASLYQSMISHESLESLESF